MKTHAVVTIFLTVITVLVPGSRGGGRAAPLNYAPPPETASLLPGASVEVARANCSPCHSFDYITTQPRGQAFGKDFWRAEVTKMIKVYGAPISEDDATTIVEYLASTYQ